MKEDFLDVIAITTINSKVDNDAPGEKWEKVDSPSSKQNTSFSWSWESNQFNKLIELYVSITCLNRKSSHYADEMRDEGDSVYSEDAHII